MSTFTTGNLLPTIKRELDYFKSKNGLPANYIVVHEADTPLLINEMIKAGMMPKDGQTERLLIDSARIIRTRDVRQGTVILVLN